MYVMMEIKPESEYVTHHIQKIVGVFLNMRNFASKLKEDGHHLKYFKINDEDNEHSFSGNLKKLIERHSICHGAFLEPDEYRLDQVLEQTFQDFKMIYSRESSEHFYTERSELSKMFQGKNSIIMEYFYREMRKKHGVLMEGGEPIGGDWNYDKQNRNKLPDNHKIPIPKLFKHDVRDLIEEIKDAELPYIGKINAKAFEWPTSRSEALAVMDYFIDQLLENFGTYQDALSQSSWSIYHSRLSFALNLKLLTPMELVDAVEEHWNNNKDTIAISQVEGFVRQILGWREFMRGIYWKYMPDYQNMNHFGHQRKLPSFYWNGNTKMNCLHHAIRQSLDHGYAHHIQRLMITGNFALLAGVDPDEVDEWYLGIYTDAYQWVEITNTRGMSQYADGGIVGTKPYISSASYINKMSDYCKSCHYQHTKKTGTKACPFNSLYWRFLSINEDKLSSNPRMTMMYNVWQKMDDSTKNELIDQANYYLDYIEEL